MNNELYLEKLISVKNYIRFFYTYIYTQMMTAFQLFTNDVYYCNSDVNLPQC